MNLRRLKWIGIFVVVLLTIATLIAFMFVHGGMLYSILFAYPSPEYNVESYGQLQDKMNEAPEQFILPAMELVREQDFGSIYTVWLKDRFHDDPGGYYLCVYTTEDRSGELTVNCRLISAMCEEPPVLEPTEEYSGVGLQVSGENIQFILDACMYTVSTDDAELSMQIATSIIDRAG